MACFCQSRDAMAVKVFLRKLSLVVCCSLSAVTAAVQSVAVTQIVHQSMISVRLNKIDEQKELDHVRAVFSTPQPKQESVFLETRYTLAGSELQLHDQVMAPKKLATYFGTIGVGFNPTTTFRVLFDTGSCEFWVPDGTCASTQCEHHTKYKHSSTFAPRYDDFGNPSMMNVEYLSGKLQGYDGLETVFLGNDVVVPQQTLSFATVLDIPLLADLEWDGIVGLGFGNRALRERGAKTLMEHVMRNKILAQRNMANQFSYFLSKNGGAVTFGGVDLRLKRSPEEEFMWVPVDPANGYWTVKVLGIRKEMVGQQDGKNADVLVEESGFHDGGKDSIVDSGTYLIYAPRETIEGYLSDIQVTSCDDKRRLWSLVFQIQGNTEKNNKHPSVVELVMTPDDYVLEFEENGVKECMLGIAPDDSEDAEQLGGWTFGQVFMRSFYTVFDIDHLQMGFVRSNSTPNEQQPHSSGMFMPIKSHSYSNN